MNGPADAGDQAGFLVFCIFIVAVLGLIIWRLSKAELSRPPRRDDDEPR